MSLDSQVRCNLNCCDSDGNTPLHWASMKGHGAVVSHLMAQSADVSIRNEEGKTPLDVATNARVIRALSGLEEGKIRVDVYMCLNRVASRPTDNYKPP